MESVGFLLNERLYHIEADLDTCIKLLSDNTFAIDYLTRAVHANVIDGVSDEDLPYLQITRPEEQPHAPVALGTLNKSILSKQEIWVANRRPTDIDREATDYFLSIRGSEKFKKLFNDRKHPKQQLWNEIAELISAKGFYLGEGKVAAEKVRQKFANLQKQYIVFNQQSQQSSTPQTEKPMFYDMVHSILGDKDKINPKKIVESVDVRGVEPSTSVISGVSVITDDERPDMYVCQEEDEQPPNKKNRFENVKKKIRPPTLKEEFLTLSKEIESNQKEHFSKIDSIFKEFLQLMSVQTELLREQNQQRNILINILKDISKPKRKRNSESD